MSDYLVDSTIQMNAKFSNELADVRGPEYEYNMKLAQWLFFLLYLTLSLSHTTAHPSLSCALLVCVMRMPCVQIIFQVKVP